MIRFNFIILSFTVSELFYLSFFINSLQIPFTQNLYSCSLRNLAEASTQSNLLYTAHILPSLCQYFYNLSTPTLHCTNIIGSICETLCLTKRESEFHISGGIKWVDYCLVFVLLYLKGRKSVPMEICQLFNPFGIFPSPCRLNFFIVVELLHSNYLL